MSRGAWMPMRTFSPMIDSTETSMSSPIMMLWFDFRVRTSMWGPPCHRGGGGHLNNGPVERQATGVQESHLHRLPRQGHGTTLTATAPQSDPRLGPPGPHRRL